MSNKILLFSDIHIAQHKKSMERLNDCLKTLEWVFETAKSKNIDKIVFAGDLFQDREKIDIIVYHLVFEKFIKYCDGSIKLWLLLGNHDLWFNERWDINSVQPFSAINGVTVIDKPCALQIGNSELDFLPFAHNPIDHLKELMPSTRKRKGHKTLIAHLSIDGAKTNTMHNIYSDVIIEHDGDMVAVGPKLFRSWDKVWLGHYHGAQTLDNIEYIGSPLQLSFGEAFQDKHIVIYDTEDGSTEYVDNDFSPKHLILSKNEISKYDLSKNFVQIKVEDSGNADLIEFRKDMEKLNPSTLEIIPIQKEEEDEHFVEDAKSVLEDKDTMLEKYVNQVSTGTLDKEKLINLGKNICKNILVTN